MRIHITKHTKGGILEDRVEFDDNLIDSARDPVGMVLADLKTHLVDFFEMEKKGPPK